jgi:hypothetical protein
VETTNHTAGANRSMTGRCSPSTVHTRAMQAAFDASSTAALNLARQIRPNLARTTARFYSTCSHEPGHTSIAGIGHRSSCDRSMIERVARSAAGRPGTRPRPCLPAAPWPRDPTNPGAAGRARVAGSVGTRVAGDTTSPSRGRPSARPTDLTPPPPSPPPPHLYNPQPRMPHLPLQLSPGLLLELPANTTPAALHQLSS